MPDRGSRPRTPSRVVETPDIVDLAQGLRDSKLLSTRANERVTHFLFLTLPEWRVRFPPQLSWQFNDPALDVYDVPGCRAEAAQHRMGSVARALHVRGFALVVFHDHDNRQPICECPARGRGET